MISDKDRAVILEMCRTGMSLEVLKKCFPQFDPGDVEKLYNENQKREQQKQSDGGEGISLSCNCS